MMYEKVFLNFFTRFVVIMDHCQYGHSLFLFCGNRGMSTMCTPYQFGIRKLKNQEMRIHIACALSVENLWKNLRPTLQEAKLSLSSARRPEYFFLWKKFRCGEVIFFFIPHRSILTRHVIPSITPPEGVCRKTV